MKNIIVLLVSMVVTPLLGQKQFAEIPLLASRVWNVQAFQVGDSLFIAYDERVANGKKKAAVWITSAGHVEKLRFDELQDVALMDVIRKNDLIYYYVLSDKKKLIALEAIEENRTLKQRQKLSESIPLAGEFLASFSTQRLMNIMCFDREHGKIVLQVLDGRNVVAVKDLVSIDRKFFGKEGFEFFDKNGFTNASRGNLGIKAILDDNLLFFTIDHLEKDRTKIVRVSLPDLAIDSSAVKYHPAKNSSSLIYKDHFYRLSGDQDDVFLEVYRLSDGKRITLQPFALATLPANVSYSREGDKSEISREKAYKNTGGYGVIDFSIVIEGSDQSTYLRLGSHMGEKPGFVPVGTNALQVYLGNSMSNAIRNNDTTPGINRYFYVSESRDHETYQLVTKPNEYSDCQRADEHEITLEKGYKVNYKAYVRLADASLIGIYCLDKKLVFIRY